MALRALAIWSVLLAAAFANGIVRVARIVPRVGEAAGHIISSLMLTAVIAVIAWGSIGWMRPSSAGDALVIGAVWLVLTVAFELGAGHYLFDQPWSVLFEDYNVARGRLWVVVLAATALAPLGAAWARGLLTGPAVR